MKRVVIHALVMLLLVAPVAAQTIFSDKVVIGTFTPTASPLTVVGMAGTGDILRLGAGGSVGIGPVVIADIPSVFTRRDVAEKITSTWAFTNILDVSELRLATPSTMTGSLVRVSAGNIVGIGTLTAADIPTQYTRRDVAEAVSGTWSFSNLLSVSGLQITGVIGTMTGSLMRLSAGNIVGQGVLVAADVPSTFTQRNVAETISSNWTFSSGLSIPPNNMVSFSAGGTPAPPTVSTRSSGTRVVIYPALTGSSVDYAIGIESSTLWFSTQSDMKWYTGAATLMMKLTSEGTVFGDSIPTLMIRGGSTREATTSPGMPWTRGNGSYLVMNAPGGMHLNYDTTGTVSLGTGGGATSTGAALTVGTTLTVNGQTTLSAAVLAQSGHVYTQPVMMRNDDSGSNPGMPWFRGNRVNHLVLNGPVGGWLYLNLDSGANLWTGSTAVNGTFSVSGTSSLNGITGTNLTISGNSFFGGAYPTVHQGSALGNASNQWGSMNVHLATQAPGGTSPVYVNAAGWYWGPPSMRTSKTDIRSMTGIDGQALLKLDPIRYRLISDKDGPVQVGFILEDVETAGLKEVTFRRDSNKNEGGIYYDRIAVYLVAWAKEMEARMRALEAKGNQ